MVTGGLASHERNDAQTLDILLYGDVHYHEWMSADVVSIVKERLTKNPNIRLGCVEGEENAIRGHPFFNQIDWEAIESRNVTPPFKPTIMCKFDLSIFLWQYTRQAANITATDP